MTVDELITELAEMDPKAEVLIDTLGGMRDIGVGATISQVRHGIDWASGKVMLVPSVQLTAWKKD